jgi:GGDEF domain-containing protein
MDAIEALSTLVEVAVRAEMETESQSAPAPAAEICEEPEAAPGLPAEAPIAVTAVAEAEGPLGTEVPQSLEAPAPPMAPEIPIAAETVPSAATAMEEFVADATATGAAVPIEPEAPQAAATPVAEPAPAGQETPIEAVAESAEPAAPEAARLFSLTVPVRQSPPTAAEPATAAADWSRSPLETLRHRPSGLGIAGSLAELAKPAEAEAPRPAPLQLPAGYHGRQAGQEVLSSESLFTGFAVCISLNDFERIRKSASSNAFAELMTSIEKLMRSLLREDDFGCRISDDEIVLAYPDLTGSAAQRRASHISERLWDFQLRSLGSFSVLFSWGGLDVQDEPFNEVVESAVERMNETRNSRRSGRAGLPALPKRLAS